MVALAASNAPFFEEAANVETDCWHLDLIKNSLDRKAHPSEFTDSVGLKNGVTGFIAHAVPVSIHCALWADGDYRKAIEAALALGGDTDTVCAIVGGIVGAQPNFSGVPDEWLKGLWEWPRSQAWIERLSGALAGAGAAPSTFWPAYLVRSPLFIATVLAHGFRRMLPPF